MATSFEKKTNKLELTTQKRWRQLLPLLKISQKYVVNLKSKGKVNCVTSIVTASWNLEE